jgi:hypothetical protein
MRKLILLSSLFFLMTINTNSNLVINPVNFEDRDGTMSAFLSDTEQLYAYLGLEGKVSFRAFKQAVAGYEKIEVKKPILTLIDFSKPSTEERFYVIDMEKRKILFKSHVSHGRNSGANYTTSFSNEKGSHQSSLGFFLTENTYQGGNGLSLVLHGLEKGINDNAKARYVVIHGADYVNPRQARVAGRLGRSFGCPALPRELTRPIIETIKNGSLIYAYSASHNERYLQKSSILGN